MIAILLTVAIIIAISGTAIFEYKNIVIKAQKRELALDYYLMTQAIEDYRFRTGSLPKGSEVQITIPNVGREQFEGEPGFDEGKVEVYYIDYNKLSTEKLIRGMQKEGIDDRYVYSDWTNKLYYLQGVTIEGNTYYTLTNELYDLLDVSEVK